MGKMRDAPLSTGIVNNHCFCRSASRVPSRASTASKASLPSPRSVITWRSSGALWSLRREEVSWSSLHTVLDDMSTGGPETSEGIQGTDRQKRKYDDLQNCVFSHLGLSASFNLVKPDRCGVARLWLTDTLRRRDFTERGFKTIQEGIDAASDGVTRGCLWREYYAGRHARDRSAAATIGEHPIQQGGKLCATHG